MIRAVLADATPLYAAADESDSYHERSLRELRDLIDDQRPILVAYPTLLETHSLVLKHMGIISASRWLSYMADMTLVNPVAEDYRQAMMKVQAFADQNISLFDATVATVAARLGLEVWTYDHHFDVMRVPVWR